MKLEKNYWKKLNTINLKTFSIFRIFELFSNTKTLAVYTVKSWIPVFFQLFY